MMNSWLVTPMGLVDVTSRYRFRAAGLSNGGDAREEDVCLCAVREGLGLGLKMHLALIRRGKASP